MLCSKRKNNEETDPTVAISLNQELYDWVLI